MAEQVETVASAIIDVTDRRLELSEGPPCGEGFAGVEFPSAT